MLPGVLVSFHLCFIPERGKGLPTMNHLLAGAFALLLATQPFTAFASEPTAPLTDGFRQQIQSSLQLPQFQGLSFVGVQILDSASGTELFSLNEHKLFVPASNAKLFSSAAALDVFGPDHTFATQVEFTGILAGTTLEGDLILRGGGDPTFTGADMRALAQTVAQSVQVVNGDLIVDATLFNSPHKGPGWMWDDEPDPYSMSISALMIDYNAVQVQVTLENGKPVPRLSLPGPYPPLSYYAVPGPVTIQRRPFEHGIEVVGTEMPPSGVVNGSLSVLDPELWAGTVFRALLQENGVRFVDQVEQRSLFPETTSNPSIVTVAQKRVAGNPLAQTTGKPLGEVIALFNKPSENAIGEMLLHHLDAPTEAEPATWNGGSLALTTWLVESVGIPAEEFRLVDGSGLSRYNMVTPAATTKLLQHMYNHPQGEVYRASLPVGGVDGTLSNRLKELPVGSAVHAKTGTMSGVSSLSGYVKNQEGRWLTFSIQVNGFVGSSAPARELQDTLCRAMAASQFAPTVVGN